MLRKAWKQEYEAGLAIRKWSDHASPPHRKQRRRIGSGTMLQNLQVCHRDVLSPPPLGFKLTARNGDPVPKPKSLWGSFSYREGRGEREMYRERDRESNRAV